MVAGQVLVTCQPALAGGTGEQQVCRVTGAYLVVFEHAKATLVVLQRAAGNKAVQCRDGDAVLAYREDNGAALGQPLLDELAVKRTKPRRGEGARFTASAPTLLVQSFEV